MPVRRRYAETSVITGSRSASLVRGGKNDHSVLREMVVTIKRKGVLLSETHCHGSPYSPP